LLLSLQGDFDIITKSVFRVWVKFTVRGEECGL